MENGAISDVQISASSQLNANHAANKGRLNSGKVGSWSPGTDSDNQWLQIDLGNPHTRVTAVATQGGNATNNWVTRYKLQYSDNGIIFKDYKEGRQHTSKVREIPTLNGDKVTFFLKDSNSQLTPVSIY